MLDKFEDMLSRRNNQWDSFCLFLFVTGNQFKLVLKSLCSENKHNLTDSFLKIDGVGFVTYNSRSEQMDFSIKLVEGFINFQINFQSLLTFIFSSVITTNRQPSAWILSQNAMAPQRLQKEWKTNPVKNLLMGWSLVNNYCQDFVNKDN